MPPLGAGLSPGQSIERIDLERKVSGNDLDRCGKQRPINLSLPPGASQLQHVYLKGNENLSSPPVEIAEQGSDAILRWFAAEKAGLKEIKVLLVGDAKAGKTSLLRRLRDDGYNPSEVQTDGIIIETFEFESLPTFKMQERLHGITAYFWDFGGQEIMKSTHQFFMTKRSIYLLVMEARNDAEPDKQVRQWLKRIQTFGGPSQVIVVVNKMDLNRAFDLDTYSLRKEFPQIKDFHFLSCETGEKIAELKDALEEIIPKAELFDTEIDERWLEIKDNLQKETRGSHYIGYRKFIEICEAGGLNDRKEQKEAITFLNDLGVLLHFDELDLSEYFVLDPYWVSSGVYQIITSPTIGKQGGKLKVDQLDFIVNREARKEGEYLTESRKNVEYSPNELRYLADIMAQFRLSYYTDNRENILIPDLLPRATPVEDSEELLRSVQKLRLVYRYEYLPNSVLPRFMVEMQKDIAVPWRTGVILKNSRSNTGKGMLTATEDQINILIVGEHKEMREYLSIVRFFLDRINAEFKIDPTLRIPLPGFESLYVDYDVLLKMEKAGETKYKNWEIEKEFPISQLLDGLQSKEEIRQQEQQIVHLYGDIPTLTGRKKEKVLFLFSNPKDKNPIDFGAELSKIQKLINPVCSAMDMRFQL